MSSELHDNVVSLQDKKTSARKRPEVISQVSKLTSAWLKSTLQSLFESVDDALFDLAERAENNNIQTQYFDGMREIRKKRRNVESVMHELFADSVERFSKGLIVVQTDESDASEIDEDSLSLVGDTELEESLAVSNMIAKGESKYSKSLFALNHRLGIANSCAPPEDTQNPVGPANFCHCFRESMTTVTVEISVLLILYKLFDKQVINSLGKLYDELNAYLIGEDILPRIKHSRFSSNQRHSSDVTESEQSYNDIDEPTGEASEAGETAEVTEPAAEQAAQEEPQKQGFGLFQSIQGLLANRRKRREQAQQQDSGNTAPAENGHDQPAETAEPSLTGQPASPAVQHPILPEVATSQMLNALTVLQAETLNKLNQISEQGSGKTTAEPVKSAMIEQIKALSGMDQAGAIPGEEEDAIDLVAMLFEYIQEDKNLPDSMQALIGRLQIPYIKVALLDQHLFAKQEHPARMLLNRLADASVGWSEQADPGRKLYDKISDIVDSVVRDFDDDIELFDKLNQEFDAFETKRHKRVAVAEKRATETARGHERLQLARQAAANEIASRIDGQELPGLVSELLRKPLANAMVLQYLRGGEESEEWQQSVEMIDKLVWSIKPKESSADVARLQSTLPHISHQLRLCLESVAYHENDIKAVFKDLKSLYKSLISEKYHKRLSLPEGVSEEARDAMKTMALPESVTKHNHEDLLKVAEQIKQESPDREIDVNEVFMQQIEELKIGTWFAFQGLENEPTRAKLSWKSPITSKFLFVSQKGLKVADKSIIDLAEEIKNGQTEVLDPIPLFDRALKKIMSSLEDESGESDDSDPAETPADTEQS